MQKSPAELLAWGYAHPVRAALSTGVAWAVAMALFVVLTEGSDHLSVKLLGWLPLGVVLGAFSIVLFRRAITRSPAGAQLSLDVDATPRPVDGTVVFWDVDQAWGVVASPAVDGEVYTDRLNLAAGHRKLRAGQPVRFTYEAHERDGYPNRAVTVEPR